MIIYGLIDIDNFRSFNEKFGYEKGNIILMKLEKLSIEILNPDTWRKLDGDEFLFSCTGSFECNKIKFPELLTSIQEDLGITISIGLSEVNTVVQFEQIIEQLKLNMLTAKINGKNQICLT